MSKYIGFITRKDKKNFWFKSCGIFYDSNEHWFYAGNKPKIFYKRNLAMIRKAYDDLKLIFNTNDFQVEYKEYI